MSLDEVEKVREALVSKFCLAELVNFFVGSFIRSSGYLRGKIEVNLD